MSSRKWLVAVSAAVGVLALAGSAVSAAGFRLHAPRLARVHTWAFAIGDGDLSGNLLRRYAAYDLLVLDGEGATRAQVSALRGAGKIVLGYLDVGTIEPFRSWYPLLRPYRMAYWPQWGEWYARVTAGYRAVIVQRIAPMLLRKGFDGLFLDNTDMIEAYPRQTAGMRLLVRALARLIHGHGRLLFAQNGEATIGPLLPYYDGWNREDLTATYDGRYLLQPRFEVRAAQRALRRIAGAGLLVLATDYTAARDRAGAAQSVADACAAGALPFVSDIDLTRIPAQPARCP
jgi:endo-alpha-1,4-polygalactosaminidase (GH114 family)